MQSDNNIIIAAKCAPVEKILSDIEQSGIEAAELYLSEKILQDINAVISTCKKFNLQYAVHAPTDCYLPRELSQLATSLDSKRVIFHNIYWDDEWKEIVDIFKNTGVKLCIENISTLHEPLKFMRRYNFNRCLDLEHLQMECAGVYEEVFLQTIKQASHIHLTGYVSGSDLWHTHIHYSPEHNVYMLFLIH